MPTLFISYKRGTTAIAPLMERLRAAKYRLWFDRDDIHLGDPSWKERIDRGLERSDGVILGITPAACASVPIQYEVQKARELGKVIFPVILERVTSIEAALTDLGLSPEQHVEDFTDVEHWEMRCEKLLADLRYQGLTVTRHDLRQERGEAAYALHQRYLKRVAERVGRLQLSLAAGDEYQVDGVPLEQVYVDGPTPLHISVEVQNWQVVDWWISRAGETRGRPDIELDSEPAPRIRPKDLGYEDDALESLIERVEQRIADFREENPDAKPDDDYSRKTYRDNPGKNGPHDDVLTLNAQDIAAARDRLVILGAPGSGKSTFVKHLALCLVGAQLDGWTRPAKLDALGQWPHGTLTPVYVELRRLVASEHFPARIEDQPTVDHLWRYIEHDLLGADLAAYADDLKQDLEQGHAVLILDGLDEVPYPEGKLAARQGQLRHLALSINDEYGPSRVIVASRPYAYEGWTLPDFEDVTLADFEDQHRRELARKLYMTAGLPEDDADDKANRLNNALRPIDPQLKDRPLFLTLMATIFLQGDKEGLPARRGALYRQSIRLLLERWTQSKANARSLTDILGGAGYDDLYARLAALAYDVHQTADGQGVPQIDVGLLFKHLMPLGFTTAGGLIPYLSENAGVLVSPGQDDKRDVFYFAHRSFQEYLAGAHLVSQCRAADRYTLIREHIQRQPQLWREPCQLAGDVLADTNRARNLWDLVNDLLDEEMPDTPAAGDERWWAVWLAARVAREHGLHEQTSLGRGERAVREALVEWLVQLIQTPQALEPPERADCGMALGLLDDPRKGVSLRKDGLPDIDWVEIPAGEFIYQDGEKLHLDTFYMSRYLITYRQFQVFIDAEDGFTNPKWREGLAADDEHKQTPGEQAFKYGNHPRERVSWWDAVAFCRWLSDKLGYEVTLPTEQEWEKAARGTDGREYPYGNEFDASKGNTSETGLRQTSAVGLFPDGVSPYDLFDMSGNVWQWCLNEYDNPEKTDLGGSSSRVGRGGSWNDNSHYARCAYRDDGLPLNRLNSNGFRVVCGRCPL